VRDYADRRKAVIDAVMNPSTDEALRRQHIEFEAGVTDVLGWPGRVLSQADEPAERIIRAGVGSQGEEQRG
jgi:hypothetical protein